MIKNLIQPVKKKQETIFGYASRCSFSNSFNAKQLYYERKEQVPSHSGRYVNTDTFGVTNNKEHFGKVISSIDKETLTNFKYETSVLMGPFKRNIELNIPYFTSDTLKLCPYCIANGEHYQVQQLRFVNKCPKHRCKLINVCPTCGKEIPYFITAEDKIGIECPTCHKQLFENFKDGCDMVIDDYKENKDMQNIKVFKYPNDIIHAVILDTKANSNLSMSKELKNFLFDLAFRGKRPAPTFSMREYEDDIGMGKTAFKLTGSYYDNLETFLCKKIKGTEETAPPKFKVAGGELAMPSDTIERTCMYMWQSNGKFIVRRTIPRQLDEVNSLLEYSLSKAKFRHKYHKNALYNRLVVEYMEDTFNMVYKIFDKCINKNYYVSLLNDEIPVLDYEVVILELDDGFDVYIFKTYTDAKKYRIDTANHTRKAIGYTPFRIN